MCASSKTKSTLSRGSEKGSALSSKRDMEVQESLSSSNDNEIQEDHALSGSQEGHVDHSPPGDMEVQVEHSSKRKWVQATAPVRGSTSSSVSSWTRSKAGTSAPQEEGRTLLYSITPKKPFETNLELEKHQYTRKPVLSILVNLASKGKWELLLERLAHNPEELEYISHASAKPGESRTGTGKSNDNEIQDDHALSGSQEGHVDHSPPGDMKVQAGHSSKRKWSKLLGVRRCKATFLPLAVTHWGELSSGWFQLAKYLYDFVKHSPLYKQQLDGTLPSQSAGIWRKKLMDRVMVMLVRGWGKQLHEVGYCLADGRVSL